jgi:hypothetical protein
MHETLRFHFEKALQMYSSDEYYQYLLAAKDQYFAMTGKINEEDDDFEGRMSAFNEWYLLEHIIPGRSQTLIEDYLINGKIEDYIATSFRSVNHSVFEFVGKNLKRQECLKDILHDSKIVLAKDQSSVPVLKGDIFIGRTLPFNSENYLMSGMCVLPEEAKSILKRESKKVRKLSDKKSHATFLIEVELLKVKWSRYHHVDVDKIFVFQSK